MIEEIVGTVDGSAGSKGRENRRRIDDNGSLAASATVRTIDVREIVNRWISERFPDDRRFMGHATPVPLKKGWQVDLLTWSGRDRTIVGSLVVNDGEVELMDGSAESISEKLAAERGNTRASRVSKDRVVGPSYEFLFGDGVRETEKLDDRSVDLLLTDPPYGISRTYTCERQVPRRLRKNGKDFIMPKGNFGEWDRDIPRPAEWTSVVLPKISGWAVIFCAQAQIGEYVDLLTDHGFVAVGTLVWQKTNPVPFNHRFKPVNAWEAAVTGKRSGTPFNGRNVHNVFLHRSPSPAERIHPTQKPLGLVSEFVGLFSEEGGLVLDPFAGSATTVIAAIQAGRHVLAYENDPNHFEAAARRLENSGTLL